MGVQRVSVGSVGKGREGGGWAFEVQRLWCLVEKGRACSLQGMTVDTVQPDTSKMQGSGEDKR